MIALRYLRPKRTFVSIITAICVIGVMLGVAVLIIVLSVMSGFDHDLREKIFGFKSHLTVSSTSNRLRDWERTAELIRQNTNVTGVAPYVMTPVMVERESGMNDSQVAPQVIRGIDPKLESSI